MTHQEVLAEHSKPLPNGCIVWIGRLNRDGYGQSQRRSPKIHLAHRLAYFVKHGHLPKEIDHICRNRACVNPDHLQEVSHTENMRRGAVGNVNRNKTHCPNGHPLSGKNLRIAISGGYARRKCRTCEAYWNKRWYQRIKGIVP